MNFETLNTIEECYHSQTVQLIEVIFDPYKTYHYYVFTIANHMQSIIGFH